MIDTAAAFHVLVEGIREGAAILAFDRTVLTCNRRLAEMLKLECAQLMGRSMLEFIPLEDQPRFEALLQSAPAEFQRLQVSLSGGDTFPLPVELAIKSLTVGGARVFSLLATGLSRRRRAEEQLAFQAHLLSNVSDAILAMDEHFRITYWNPAAERLYGWTAEQVLGRTASEVLHPQLSVQEQRELNSQLAAAGRFDNQSWHRRRDGTPIWVEGKRIALRAPDGRMLGYVSVNRDMTDRMRAEAEIRRLNAELEQRVVERTAELEVANQELKKEIAQRQSEILARERTEATLRDVLQSLEDTMLAARESEELLSIAIEAAGMVAWTYDPQKDKVISAVRTPDWLQILTEENFPLLGRGLEIVHPDDRAKLAEALPRVIAGEPFSIEVRLLSPDGAVRWIATQGRLRTGSPGKPPLLYGVTQDIAERKRAEEQLKQLNRALHDRTRELDAERARWQGVVEGIADEVWVADAEGRMSLINLPAVTQMGLEEFKDKTVEDVYEEVDILNLDGRMRPPEQAPLLRSLKGEIVRGEEIVRHRRTGKTRYRQFSSAPTRDAAGAITGAVAIVRDVTGHKQVEQAFRQSNRCVTEILESIQDGFFALDREWHFTYVNRRASSKVGVSPEALIGQNLWGLFPDLLGTPLEKHYRTVMAERIPVRFETTGVRTGTSYEVRVYPSAKGISVYWIDITERKRTEEEIQSLARFPSENPSPVLRLDSGGTILYANPACAEVLKHWGCAEGSVAPEFVLAEVAQTRTVRHIRVIEVDAGDRIFSFTIVPIEESGYVNLYGLDITERKQAEKNIHQLNRDLDQRATELEVANHELESFSYSVSHDLRTPLAAIDALSRAMLEDYGAQLSEDGRRHLRFIHENVMAMNRLIEDLLAFSRTARQALDRHTVDVRAMVHQVAEELHGAYAGRRVEIAVEELASAQADPVLLKQVWVNLLSNALKYTRRQQVAHIEIGSYEKDGETIYVVKDNGVGFDPAHAEKLFGVFQRLHSEEEYEGTGVGLAIVARIVHRHGGRVWADARVNKGATFYFTLEPTAPGNPRDSVPGILRRPR